jgi:hypothetical protein
MRVFDLKGMSPVSLQQFETRQRTRQARSVRMLMYLLILAVTVQRTTSEQDAVLAMEQCTDGWQDGS